MSQNTELVALMTHIGDRYTFTPEQYPALKGKTPEQRRAFAVNHNVLHMLKSVGRLAGESERYDHGGKMDGDALREGVVKMLINTLKLAEELGLSAQDLADSVPAFMQSK